MLHVSCVWCYNVHAWSVIYSSANIMGPTLEWMGPTSLVGIVGYTMVWVGPMFPCVAHLDPSINLHHSFTLITNYYHIYIFHYLVAKNFFFLKKKVNYLFSLYEMKSLLSFGEIQKNGIEAHGAFFFLPIELIYWMFGHNLVKFGHLIRE